MLRSAQTLTFSRDGAERIGSAAAATTLRDLDDIVERLPQDGAGVRIYGIPAIRPLLAPSGPVGAIAKSMLGSRCRPVRAILFDKSAATNWALAWHQDRTIAVA